MFTKECDVHRRIDSHIDPPHIGHPDAPDLCFILRHGTARAYAYINPSGTALYARTIPFFFFFFAAGYVAPAARLGHFTLFIVTPFILYFIRNRHGGRTTPAAAAQYLYTSHLQHLCIYEPFRPYVGRHFSLHGSRVINDEAFLSSITLAECIPIFSGGALRFKFKTLRSHLDRTFCTTT